MSSEIHGEDETPVKQQLRRKGTKRSRLQAGLTLDPANTGHVIKNDIEEVANNEAMEIMNVAAGVALTQPSSSLLESGQSPKIFFTPDPGELLEVEEVNTESTNDSYFELHEMPTSVIKSSSFPGSQPPEVVQYEPSSAEGDYRHRVRTELGFELPHVMSQYVEEMVQNCWDKLKKDGKVTLEGECAESKFHSTVVDAQVSLVKLLEAYIKRRYKTRKKPIESAEQAAMEALGPSESEPGGQQDSDCLSAVASSCSDGDESWTSDKSE